MAAIYTVFTSPHHELTPGYLPTLIVTPHGKPQQILYSYLHTEENRVNYLLTPSAQGDLCVAKMFPPQRGGSQPMAATASAPALGSKNPPAKIVRCEASRDLRWTIENTGIMSPIYKIVNQDDTPLYQISKPNPNAEFWTMFYFKYAGHQIPPKRIEFGRISKNPPEKGGGTRISITGKTEDEKMVWQTLGVGNEDCVEWVVCCACLNLLDDQIVQQAERNGAPRPSGSTAGPASTAASGSRPIAPPLSRAPASTGSRPVGPGLGAGIASSSSAPPAGRPIGPGIASTAPPAANLAQTYRRDPNLVSRVPPSGPGGYRQLPGGAGSSRPAQPPSNGGGGRPSPGPMQFANGYDPRSRAPPPAMQNGSYRGQQPPPPQQYQPPSQQMQQQQQQQSRNGMGPRGPPAGSGRRF